MKVQRALGLIANNKRMYLHDCVNIHRLHAIICTLAIYLLVMYVPSACHNLLFVIHAAFRDYSSYILIEEIWSI